MWPKWPKESLTGKATCQRLSEVPTHRELKGQGGPTAVPRTTVPRSKENGRPAWTPYPGTTIARISNHRPSILTTPTPKYALPTRSSPLATPLKTTRQRAQSLATSTWMATQVTPAPRPTTMRTLSLRNRSRKKSRTTVFPLTVFTLGRTWENALDRLTKLTRARDLDTWSP